MISINFVLFDIKIIYIYFINLGEFSSISSSIIEYNQYCFTWVFPQVIPKIFIIWQFAPFAAGLINMFYVYTLRKHCRILSTPGSSRWMELPRKLPPNGHKISYPLGSRRGTTFNIPFLQEAPAEWSCPWSSRRLGIITILQEAPAEWWSPGSSRRMGVYGDLPVPQKLPPTWHTSLCMSRKLPPNGHTVTGCAIHLRPGRVVIAAEPSLKPKVIIYNFVIC